MSKQLNQILDPLSLFKVDLIFVMQIRFSPRKVDHFITEIVVWRSLHTIYVSPALNKILCIDAEQRDYIKLQESICLNFNQYLKSIL